MLRILSTIEQINMCTAQKGDVIVCTDNAHPVISGGPGVSVSSAAVFDMRAFAQRCAELAIPLLAQGVYARLLAVAYDGLVQPQPHSAEHGQTTLLQLSTAAEDPWCASFAQTFEAQSWRIDDIMQLPLLALPLMNSERTQFQTFKIVGTPQYGVQWYREDLVDSFVACFGKSK